MAKYKGKNDNRTAISQMHWRAKYKTEAFANSSYDATDVHESIVDFNLSEMRYYGKIDDEGDPVVIRSTALVSLETPGSGETINLVARPLDRMFTHFRNKFAQAATLQKISEEDPYLANPEAHIAFNDPVREYKIYLSGIMDAFNTVWLADLERADQVRNIKDYIDQFMLYAETMKSEFPITLTGWRKSKQSSIFSTGIAISISDLDCSVDSDVEDFLLNKNCVLFYYQACKQYGFSVTEKCPWLLVADLASPATARYYAEYGYGGVRDFFTKNYRKTYQLDVQLLRPIIRSSYIDYINNNKFIKDIRICDNNVEKSINKNIYRKEITKRRYNKRFDEYFWIPRYVRIRNIEDEHPYDEPSLVRIIQKASEFEKLLDTDAAMGYINERFREKYRYAHGGYWYWSKRLGHPDKYKGG